MLYRNLLTPGPLQLFKFAGIAAFLLLAAVGAFSLQGPTNALAAPTDPNGTIPPSIEGTVTVVHAAPISAQIADTAVDICAENNQVVTGFEGLVYGQSRSLQFDPGTYDWKVARAATSCADLLLDIAPFSLAFAQDRVLVIAGDNTTQPLSIIDFAVRGGATVFLPFITKVAGTPSAR